MDKITDVPEKVWDIIDKNKLKYDIESPNFSANLVCELANKVHDMILFSFDTPHMNDDGKLPILDVKVHLTSENTLGHEFYEKPTRNDDYGGLNCVGLRGIKEVPLLSYIKMTSLLFIIARVRKYNFGRKS